MSKKHTKHPILLACVLGLVALGLSTSTALADTVPPPHPTNYSPPTLEASDCPMVATEKNWKITGGSPKNYKETCGYWGIPYAGSTAGKNRWAPPAELPSGGSFTAQEFGPWCPQLHNGTPVGSEDCLRVNIWTPKARTEKLPVMVFIHGGAFIQGASNVPTPFKGTGADSDKYIGNLYDGAPMSSEHDVVVVSINYRVGAMGFLASSSGDFDGNYGIHDQMAALEWIHNNIGNFGGDNGNVTIWGESAGAMSVALHMLSIPTSYNSKWFHAGIMESNLPGLPYKTLCEAEASFEVFSNNVKNGCDAQCLRSAKLEQLLLAQRKTNISPAKGHFDEFLEWTPVKHGIVKKQPIEGKFQQPAVFGTNHNEGILFAYEVIQGLGKGGKIPRGYYDGILGHFFGCPWPGINCTSHATAVEKNYPTGFTTPSFVKAQKLGNIITDYIFTCANDQLAKNNETADGAPVYAYLFDQTADFFTLPNPGCSTPGIPDNLALLCECYSLKEKRQAKDAVCHGAELPYVFNTPTFETKAMNTAQKGLAKDMASFWAGFAKTHEMPIAWPAYKSSAANPYMVFGPNGNGQHALGAIPSSAQCGFWQGTVKYPTSDGFANYLHGVAW